MCECVCMGGGGGPVFFFNHQRISQGTVRTCLKMQLDERNPIATQMGVQTRISKETTRWDGCGIQFLFPYRFDLEGANL